MAAVGKRKKSKKKATRPVVKALAKRKINKVKKPTASKEAKASPKKAAKRAAKKASKRRTPSTAKTKVPTPTIEQIAPSGEPEFVSNEPLLKP